MTSLIDLLGLWEYEPESEDVYESWNYTPEGDAVVYFYSDGREGTDTPPAWYVARGDERFIQRRRDQSRFAMLEEAKAHLIEWITREP